MPLTIYRRGKIWHYRGTVAGRLYNKPALRANQRLRHQRGRFWKSHTDGRPRSDVRQRCDLYRKAEKPTASSRR